MTGDGQRMPIRPLRMPTDSHRRPPLVHALPEEQILAGGQGFVELSRTRGGGGGINIILHDIYNI